MASKDSLSKTMNSMGGSIADASTKPNNKGELETVTKL
jgi:hypothetical protein